MGFELNRIMKQYGVSTPGQVNYSGASAPSATTNIVKPTTVEGLYKTVLGREPDAAGLENWKSRFGDKVDDEEYNTFLTSAKTEMGDRKLKTPVYGEQKTDPAVFDEQMRKYNLDRKSYDTYKTDYQNRLQNTPMYLNKQFDTGYGTTASTVPTGSAMRIAADKPGGIGIDQANRSIKDWFAQNPSATAAEIKTASDKIGANSADIRNAMGSDFKYGDGQFAGYGSNMNRSVLGPGGMGIDKANSTIRDYFENNPYASNTDIKDAQDQFVSWGSGGISNKDLYNATGSYYGNQLKAPTYGIAPLSFGTPQNIRNWYTQQTDLGYTDADLRTGAMQNYGAIPDDTWNSFKNSMPDNTDEAQWIKHPRTWTQDRDHYSQAQQAPLELKAARGGSVHDLMAKYAQGGAVKTHYQTAGEVRLPSGYGSPEEEAYYASQFFTPSPEVTVSPVNMDTAPEPTIITKMPAQAVIDPMTRGLGPGQAPPMSAVTAVAPDNKMQEMQAMLAAYGPSNNTYSAELKLSREKANKETEAFSRMLTAAMGSPEDEKLSKAEMYFRLAAAFGSPTKTGGFGENLALASKEMAEYSKGKRSSAKDKLALALEGQKLRMSAAKDDVTALRALSAEEMKDKRAISSKMIEVYIKSGEPQSAAGKQAMDEGLTPGTSAYQTRVQAIAAASVDAKLAQINAQVAGMSLSQVRLINEQLSTQKMSDAELRLVIDARNTIGTLEGAIGDIKQAIGLNQNAYGGNIADLTEETITQLFVPGDEKLRNTRLLKNFLGAQGVAKLRASFGGNPTEGERKILLELEGIDALTSAERAAIMVRTLDALDKKAAREKKTLEEIQSGSLRRYTKDQSLARPTTGNQ